ncbi:MAG: alpha-L-arabinofuranosidase [Verrucomicrobia bacterium]|nr:alpha-L-arabinofuranosidase [Verrucomicrobiota bacterium]
MQPRFYLHQGVRQMRRRPPSWLTVSLLLGLMITAAGLRAQTVNPAAYWPFDEGTGIVAHDASGNNHDATLQGGAGWTAGLVGPYALSLPGAPGSYADVPTDVVDTTQSYTVAAWVKLNDVNGYQTFVSEDGPEPTNPESAFFLQLRGDSHQFSFTIPYSFFINAQSGFTPVAGRWYHLAGVYDAAAQSVSLYVNGVLADTIYRVAPRAASGHTGIGHGQFAGSYVDWVNGAIDDVRLYGAALSGADILRIAQIGNPSLTVPTVQPAALEVDAAHPGARLDPLFNGLMIEEINHSLDGGLYGELIQNRDFKDDPTTPVHWSVVQDGGGAGSIALDPSQPVPNTALTVSLRVDVSHGPRVGVANEGYWGIPVRPLMTYRASFWAKAAPGFSGPLTLEVQSADGTTVYARAQVPEITTDWAKYGVLLQTFYAPFTDDARFVISTGSAGTFWLNQVSLFRPTYRNRPNGNRIDLMEMMAAMRPHFLRMPGGNYLEGNTIETRFEWKNTIGPIELRPGHMGTWGYRSDEGVGLLEFLEWCEDLNMQPLLAVYAGYSLNGTHVNPGPDLAPYVQDALDEIQYVTGSTSTAWGARRAADGHPAPFPLEYVEVGNEDFFDTSGSYEGRFAQFYDAIKATYPNLKLIATTRVSSRTPDVVDDHFYNSPRSMARMSSHYDPSNYGRTGPKIFVGEWASQEGSPTPDLFAALGDAAWLTGLERNADLVIMECYAPLLANVNPGAYQWPTNLIGYDALRSYGSPSYYMQVMFDWLHGDVVLPAKLTTSGGSLLYESVTRDTRDGTIYLKLVNMAGELQPLHVTLNGAGGAAAGLAVVLTSANPQDTNTLDEPYRVVPRIMQVRGGGPSFDLELQPYSVTVLPIGGPGHGQP